MVCLRTTSQCVGKTSRHDFTPLSARPCARLFVSQIGLVTARRVKLHQQLGVLGFALAAAMIVLGVLAASDRLTRQVGEPDKTSPEEIRAFYADPIGDMVMFATFVTFGYRAGWQRLAAWVAKHMHRIH